MTKPTIDKKKLKDLRNQLEDGDLRVIADRLGLSSCTVSKVFTGEIRNIDVIEHAISLVKQRKKVIDALNTGL